jgi:multidrug efflux pump subunit AcrA (membrane-fusion protein)
MRITVRSRASHPNEASKVSLAKKVVFTFAIVFFASAALVSAGCSRASASDPRTDPQLVVTTTAAPVKASARQFSGVIAARVQSSLGFRVNGKIIERLVEEVALDKAMAKRII